MEIEEEVESFLKEFIDYVKEKNLHFYGGKWWNDPMKIEQGYTTRQVYNKFKTHLKYKHLHENSNLQRKTN